MAERARAGRVLGGLGAVAIAGVVLLIASAVSGAPLLVEDFRGPAVADPALWNAGGTGGSFTGWPGESCLTAGSDTGQSGIAGCGLDPADADGSGALRLTPATDGRAGFALFNEAGPASAGLDITFRQAQYGGSGADGISFFLVEGATDLTEPGSSGGSLGYSAGGGAGVANGLVGVGLDLWGNFSAPGSSGSGCAAGTGAGSSGPGQTADVVAIRGPGNGSVGYCWLGASPPLGSLGRSLDGGADRASGERLVRIVFDPATVATRNVTVYLDGTQVVQVPAPQELIDAATFKFGFSAATGSVTDVHEVWDLNIETVVPVEPTTTTTTTTTTTPGPSTLPAAPPAAPSIAAPRFTG